MMEKKFSEESGINEFGERKEVIDNYTITYISEGRKNKVTNTARKFGIGFGEILAGGAVMMGGIFLATKFGLSPDSLPLGDDAARVVGGLVSVVGGIVGADGISNIFEGLVSRHSEKSKSR